MFSSYSQVRVLILGLDNAGKTTILYRLHSGEVHSSPHTNPRKLHFAQPQRAGGHNHPHYRLQRGDSNAQEPSIPSPTIPRRLRLHVQVVTLPAGVGPWRPGLHPPVRHQPRYCTSSTLISSLLHPPLFLTALCHNTPFLQLLEMLHPQH